MQGSSRTGLELEDTLRTSFGGLGLALKRPCLGLCLKPWLGSVTQFSSLLPQSCIQAINVNAIRWGPLGLPQTQGHLETNFGGLGLGDAVLELEHIPYNMRW